MLKLTQTLTVAEAGEKQRTANLQQVRQIDEQIETESYELRDLTKTCEDLERQLREMKAKARAKASPTMLFLLVPSFFI